MRAIGLALASAIAVACSHRSAASGTSAPPAASVMGKPDELALRDYREQRAALPALPKVTPFKCGPPAS